jgi:AraC family transcriptional regulator, transcriptional activator of pobA
MPDAWQAGENSAAPPGPGGARMARKDIEMVPLCSYADAEVGPRFGIRSERVAEGNRLLHRHDYFEVLFFVSSASPQRIAIREHLTRRGSIFFIPPMTPHQVRFTSTDRCYVLYFDLAFLRPDLAAVPGDIDIELLKRVPELAPFVYQQDIDFMLSEEDAEVLEGLCERMSTEHASPRLCSDEVIRSHLVLLLAEVTQRYERQIRALVQARPPIGGAEKHVKGAMKFIGTNYAEKISLSDAARRVAVSPNYLANLLKRETGKTFVQLLTEKRMDRARELLAYTNMRVSQIAADVGFADFDYFCRRFKQITGSAPLAFRSRYTIDAPREAGAPAERFALVGEAQPH